MTEAPEPIDLNAARGLYGELAPSFLADLVPTFLETAPDHVSALRDAVQREHVGDLARELHTLKGASAAIAAVPLRGLIELVESGERPAVEVIDLIDAEVDRLAAFSGTAARPDAAAVVGEGVSEAH